MAHNSDKAIVEGTKLTIRFGKIDSETIRFGKIDSEQDLKSSLVEN